MEPFARAYDIISELLEQARMPDAEVDRRVRQAEDAAYWHSLAPTLSIQTSALPPPGRLLSETELRDPLAQFSGDGYFHTPPILDRATLDSLNGAVDAVIAAGWPPVFAWVYDAFWMCARIPELAILLTSRLTTAYAQIPHIWIHVVPATAGATGWMPHFDGTGSGRASVWIALTDATVANGCMYLVPRRLLPASFATEPIESGMIRLGDALRALQATRALPVAAGSVLGWTFDVLHWGGACVSPGTPRRAISMEFLAATEAPMADETPLVPVVGPLPDLSQRLRRIAEAIDAYEKFEPGLIRYRRLAERLRR